ncbi:putative flavoprotein monooxygenase [Klebsiella pneumoniae]|uniref:Putative flavoprotein monooxygenase n=1 Tax=Klebsiella pneumoniae TaxID=573 RepID=A0A377X8C0_KLEPN|nr:putative flavoprotein monooxygenase [Klebsiella pneumoniae]
MKAIVIGAGIGGLSAAVALKQSGIDCDVYEAVKEIKPVAQRFPCGPTA